VKRELSKKIRAVIDKKKVKITPQKRYILIVDDKENIRWAFSQILDELGYETGLAEDGEEAVELFKKAAESVNPFDLVIIDLSMSGGMDGKEIVRQLNKIDPDVKAIISSGYSNDPVMTNYSSYGFVGALAKPHRKEDLIDMLNIMFENS